MKLEAISDGGEPLSIAAIGGDKALATEVQNRLSEGGLLEPPADGEFGPVSQWAMGEFMRKLGKPNKGQLDRGVAAALLDDGLSKRFPLNDTTTLAGRIVAAMRSKGWWITRHPENTILASSCARRPVRLRAWWCCLAGAALRCASSGR